MDIKNDRLSLVQRQQEALKNYEEQRNQLREALAIVLSTEEGKKVFRYIFLLSGGNSTPLCYNNGDISVEIVIRNNLSLWEVFN